MPKTKYKAHLLGKSVVCSFSLQDIRTVASLAKEKGIKTIIDNTWATPLFQKPLAMGVDLEMHSVAKYIGGHSDLVGGVLIGKQKDIDEIFHHEYGSNGSLVAPKKPEKVFRCVWKGINLMDYK